MNEAIDASETIRPTPPEAKQHLSHDQIEAIHAYSVEVERARTSDDQLWSKLLDVYNREIVLQSQIGIYHILARKSIYNYHRHWHSSWERLCSELRHKDDYIKLIAWHLSRRGQYREMAQFLDERAQYERENRLAWVNNTEPKTPTLHLVRD